MMRNQLLIMLFAWIILFTSIAVTSCKKRPDKNQNNVSETMTLQEIKDSMDILVNVADSARRINKPLACEFSLLALQLAQKTTDPGIKTIALNRRGEYFIHSKPDSSYFFYMQALKIADSADLTYQKSDIYYDIGILHLLAYDYKQAAIFMDSTISLGRRSGNTRIIIYALNTMGNISHALRDQVKSKQLWDSSYNMAKSINNFRLMGTALSNLSRMAGTRDSNILLKHQAIDLMKKPFAHWMN